MDDAILDGPWPEIRRVPASTDGDGAVLMPGDEPVHRLSLVEEDGANRMSARSEQSGGYGSDLARRRQQVCGWRIKQKPPAGTTLKLVAQPVQEIRNIRSDSTARKSAAP